MPTKNDINKLNLLVENGSKYFDKTFRNVEIYIKNVLSSTILNEERPMKMLKFMVRFLMFFK